MQIHATGDIIDGTVTGDAGIPVPDALASLPLSHLRFLDGDVVDVSDRRRFWLDPVTGALHAETGPGWKQVSCACDAAVVLDGGVYRLRTDDDDKADLRLYADKALTLAINAGITFDVGTAKAPLPVSADTTADGKANLLGLLSAYSFGLKKPEDTTTWYQTGGNVELTQAQLLALSAAVLGHIDAVYALWRNEVLPKIDSGEIATPAAVYAAFAA